MELDFGTDASNPIEGTTPSASSNSSTVTIDPGTSDVSPNDNGTVRGLSSEELNDVEKIEVVVADKSSPVVILYGSPACGKTMTMIRLARYLQKHGYTVNPVRSFRPNYDANYTKLCDNFDALINSGDAAASTSRISFMLINVIRNGKSICQIMEAPGEHYFNPKTPTEKYPRYLRTIISDNALRKVWCVMVEPVHTNKRMPDLSDRKNYVTKITNLKRMISSRDRFVFIYNKIDETEFVISQGKVHTEHARKDVQNNYPNIFVPFKNNIPLVNIFVPYNYDFVPFQTGDFGKTTDNTIVYDEGPDDYPRKLWEVIEKNVRG